LKTELANKGSPRWLIKKCPHHYQHRHQTNIYKAGQ
jgi:hypothetical protein